MNVDALLKEGWTLFPVMRLNAPAGFFCVRGDEIHCHREERFAGRWLTRQDLERLTAPMFERYGCVRTKVRTHNEIGHRFVQRLGFVKTHDADGATHYETKRLNHARL